MTEAMTGASRNDRETSRRHVHLHHVRFADLDPLNHVNNVQMLTYLEDARIALLHFDSHSGGGSPIGHLVVGRHEVDYLRPLLLRRDPVRVETWVAELRRASFTLAYEVRDDSEVYMRARSVLVGFDPQTQRTRRLTAAEREYLGGYLVPRSH